MSSSSSSFAFALAHAVFAFALSCTRHDLSTPAPESITTADSGAASAPNATSATGTTDALPLNRAALPLPANVRFVGRVDRSNPNAVRFAWSGTEVVGRFQGTSISARIRDDGTNFFEVLIDGEPKFVLQTQPNREIYSLAESLPDAVHEIALYKRTEARVGEAVFLGFEGSATMMPSLPPSTRRIEFLGDSITTGYGNEGPGVDCTFNPAQQNEYITYGAITARMLGAEHVTVAWSGKTIGEMTEYWERTLPARAESRWDHQSWVPQLVVLNVGTNDFAIRDPGEPRFVRMYIALFSRVREAYPNALVVCALGPMLSDAYPAGRRNRTLAKRYMQATMEKLKAAGQTHFEYLDFLEQRESDGLGCGYHPGRTTHALMAERLAAFVKERLGW
ncbi:MAG: GDSL-type esterase/lipase family protein [Polyangiaceae bacterium]|nr:GDSL-type esterase/lipase family protein [Polyangiaceae bacterium]